MATQTDLSNPDLIHISQLEAMADQLLGSANRIVSKSRTVAEEAELCPDCVARLAVLYGDRAVQGRTDDDLIPNDISAAFLAGFTVALHIREAHAKD